MREGGLQVYTTIDPRLQRDAEHAITETLNLRTDPASALVAIDPRDGAIRAMNAVTPGQKGNQFNLAVQARRQPGSTFKTFVLTTAVAKGINPASSDYVSAPFEYQPNPKVPAWNVTTYDHSYVGWISIEQATLRSDNTVYAQLTIDVGPSNVVAMAHRLGIQSPLAPGARRSGSARSASRRSRWRPPTRPCPRAGSTRGRWRSRRSCSRTGRRTRTPAGASPRGSACIPEGVAYVVTKILEENVLYGTGTAANIGRPAAGKTGTTDNHADAWFVGYTPTLDAAVWVGYPQGEIPMTDVHGISVSGGSFPAQIWHAFMEPALGSLPKQDWTEPKELPTWKPFRAASTRSATSRPTCCRRPPPHDARLRRRRPPRPPARTALTRRNTSTPSCSKTSRQPGSRRSAATSTSIGSGPAPSR